MEDYESGEESKGEPEPFQYYSSLFHLGEHVDCLDSVNKWCNGEIVAVI
jgi:hypothetical protein